MTRSGFRIDAVEVHDHVLDKIESKHGVTFEEVEEACLEGARHVRRVREGRYLALGVTSQGRYLASFVARDEAFVFRLISARDMTSGERRLYEQHTTKGR